MLGRRANVSCPECGVGVPAARWCNWCGAALTAPPTTPALGHTVVPRVMGIAAAIGGVVALAIGVTGSPPAADVAAGTAVVLTDDAPTPPPSMATPPSTEPRADVVCSDLRRHSVPTRLLDDTEPGSLSHLVWGPCIVMGPEGATLP